MKKTSAQFQIITAMVIFGTIGLFVRRISLPSSVIAMVRGFVGAALLLLAALAGKKRPNAVAIRKNLGKLLLSGVLIGFNWILLFEAYRFTTVATATLCYYLAPVFITLASPLVLKERLTAKKAFCVLAALLGMVPVSGVLTAGFLFSEMTGVVLGVGAAVLYASVILLNKKLADISAMDRTMVQLFFSGAALIPYVLLTEDVAALSCSSVGLWMLVVVAVVHTGLAYLLYFGSLTHISAQASAIISYVDPVVAVLLSALVLKEEISVFTVLGAVLILGAAIVSEAEKPLKRRNANVRISG